MIFILLEEFFTGWRPFDLRVKCIDPEIIVMQAVSGCDASIWDETTSKLSESVLAVARRYSCVCAGSDFSAWIMPRSGQSPAA